MAAFSGLLCVKVTNNVSFIMFWQITQIMEFYVLDFNLSALQEAFNKSSRSSCAHTEANRVDIFWKSRNYSGIEIEVSTCDVVLTVNHE